MFPEILEISWTLVDAPGNFKISNVIFACQAIFSTLYVGKSLGKQDHYDLGGFASLLGKCQLKLEKGGNQTLQHSPAC